jgi:amidase
MAMKETTTHHATVSEHVRRLRSREVSSLELVETAIACIEAHDLKLNAVVVRDFERARAAARAADQALGRGEQKPLLGVPITVKESFHVPGLPATWGIPGTEKMPVTDEAVAVTRLKEAGAIVLGKTNVPLMLGDWQSYNAIYGVTNNPWDVSRTPGGSSGGSAAALAAGYVPLELGSDIGGSLRVPASFCGVFAHKPTYGLVPMRGAAPPGVPELSVMSFVDLAVAGPMARCADDLMTGLDIIAGPDAPEAVAYRLELPPARHATLKDYRVLVLDEHPLLPTAREVQAELSSFAERLGKAGCKVGAPGPEMPDLAQMGIVFAKLLMSFLAADMPEKIYAGAVARAEALRGNERDLASARLAGIALSHRNWVHVDRMRAGLADQWRRLFKDWDVVVCPVISTAAFPHDHRPMDQRTIDVDGRPVPYFDQFMWVSMATVTGSPATAMPVGMTASGLPVGAQIIGPYLGDRTTIDFAALAEREFGGFTPPPGY